MFDKKGNILTTNKGIENIALEVYSERIESNTIKPHLKDSETLTNALCESRLETKKSLLNGPWTILKLLSKT